MGEAGGVPISASTVRSLIQEDKIEQIKALVPASTYDFFMSAEGEPVKNILMAK